MRSQSRAKLLRIHISEGDREHGHPLYEAIVDKCRELKIAGATVFRGLEGYGETAEMHRPHLGAHNQPIVVTIVDSPEAIDRLAPVIEAMMNTGVIAISEVSAVRIQK